MESNVNVEEFVPEAEDFDFDKIHEIIINGNKISAKLNGNNYIAEEDVPDDIVAQGDYIKSMTIDDEEYIDQKCTNKYVSDGKIHLVFHYITPQEKRDMEKDAKIEYLSMLLYTDWE